MRQESVVLTYPASRSPAICGKHDTPEKGIQGDVNSGTVNCGLMLLSSVPGGGAVQISGHCAYVREQSAAMPYNYNLGISAYSLANPMKPVLTARVPTYGASESMRSSTVGTRAILVSGRGVYDVSHCETPVLKGQIAWPELMAQGGVMVQARSGHEIAISQDGKRVYSGLGMAVADISNLNRPDTWTVTNWACEINRQASGDASSTNNDCTSLPVREVATQVSHSADDNPQGTLWYGANQADPAIGHIVDISRPGRVKIVDTLVNFPGHGMNWWRASDGRQFLVGSEEGTSEDTCAPYPRDTAFNNAAEAYIVEVTDGHFNKKAYAAYRLHPSLTMAINRPENCNASSARSQPSLDRPGNLFNSKPSITETSIYNQYGAAMLMMEFGTAGLRVFDVRDGFHPKEVAYYNDGVGFVHSGLFSYDPARGIIVTSGSQAMQVLVVEPSIIKALGLPKPTDRRYPYLEILRTSAKASTAPARAGSAVVAPSSVDSVNAPIATGAVQRSAATAAPAPSPERARSLPLAVMNSEDAEQGPALATVLAATGLVAGLRLRRFRRRASRGTVKTCELARLATS